MKRDIKNFSSGFTLLEIILGLAIFSFIALILYNTFAGGVKLSRRSENLNRVYREARWSFNQMTRDLENMVPYDYSNSYENLVAFSGTSKEFTLTLPTEEGLAVVKYNLQKPDYGSVHKIIIGQRSSRNKNTTLSHTEEQILENLVREQIPFVDYLSSSKGDGVEVDVLSSRVQKGGMKFQYANLSEDKNSKLIWSSQWSKKELPVGVRIELTFINKNNDDPIVLHKDVLVPRRMAPKVKSQ